MKKAWLGGYYNKIIDETDEWHASSEFFKLGDTVLGNTVAYYVDGTEHTATSLEILLEMNKPDESQPALQKFRDCARTLYHKALTEVIPPDIENLLASYQEFSIETHGKEVSLSKEDWPKEGGYSLRFFIRNLD